MRLLPIVSLIILVGSGCSDDPAPISKPEALAEACVDATSQAEMNACAAGDYREADDELNRVYRVAIGSVSGDEEQRLRAAQRAWIPFRDSQCESEAAEVEGGSLYPTVLNTCLAALTRQRTAELRSYAEPGR